MTNKSSLIEKFGVYAYKSNLIAFEADNHQNWRHRELAIQEDGLAKAYICELDKEIFAEKPVTKPDIFQMSEREPVDTESESSEIDVDSGSEESSSYDITQEWDLEKWDKLLTKMFNLARAHSFSVVQLYNTPPYWRVFCWREIQSITFDAMDNPIGCKVAWNKRLVGSDEYRYHEENLIFYREDKNLDNAALLVAFGNPSGDELGEYDLQGLWDYLIYIRYATLDIVNNSAKTSGFYHWIFGSGSTPEDREDLIDSGDVVSSTNGVGATRGALEEIKSIFPAKPEFTVLALEQILKLFAGAARLPLTFFRSEREGGAGFGGTAGYIDEDLVIKKKKYIFGEFAQAIKTLVRMRWGIILEDVKPFIQAEFDAIEMSLDDNKDNEPEKNKQKEDE